MRSSTESHPLPEQQHNADGDARAPEGGQHDAAGQESSYEFSAIHLYQRTPEVPPSWEASAWTVSNLARSPQRRVRRPTPCSRHVVGRTPATIRQVPDGEPRGSRGEPGGFAVYEHRAKRCEHSYGDPKCHGGIVPATCRQTIATFMRVRNQPSASGPVSRASGCCPRRPGIARATSCLGRFKVLAAREHRHSPTVERPVRSQLRVPQPESTAALRPSQRRADEHRADLISHHRSAREWLLDAALTLCRTTLRRGRD